MRWFYSGIRGVARLCALVLVLGLVACGGGAGAGAGAGGAGASTQSGGLSAKAQLGEKIFHDLSLSSGGNQSCASCHDANHAHAAPNLRMVQLGSDGVSEGSRVSPSIRYLANNQPLRFDAEGAPSGGFFWDGRKATLAEQAKAPFLNPVEMANGDVATVISRLSQATYAAEFKALFGSGIFNDPDAAFERVALALQAYQQEDPSFAPFDSKYDAFLRGQTTLSTAELRGLAWFNSPSKGNCAACHPSGITPNGRLPLFTDFSYDNLGVPKNWLALNSHGDLGLCANGTEAIKGLPTSAKDALCGAFKVPSLRNVGERKAYFHNGRFTHLTDVVTFYVQRDTHPERWYLDANQQPDVKFNDLPEAYLGNVNTSEAPYNRLLGGEPALNSTEIDEVVSFLCTLSDGWPTRSSACNR